MIEWIVSDAGAGWVIGAVSLAVLVITRIRKARPSRLIFRETQNIEPVTIRDNMRDRISIRFEGEPVENLSQVEADLLSSGGKVIKNPEITVAFPSGVRILDALLVDKPKGGSVTHEGNKAIIKLPFLNPHREHRHVERVSFMLSGRAERLLVGGMAQGWSVRHLRIPTRKERRRTIRRYLLACAVSLPLSVVYGLVLARWFGIPMSEISLRAFIYYLPAFLLYAVLFILVFKIRRLIIHS